MSQTIGKLVGRRNGGYVFVDCVWDYPTTGGQMRGAGTSELSPVSREDVAWSLTDEGLVYWLEDRYPEEKERDPAIPEFLPWARAYMAEDPGRIYDTSYHTTYWPQIRALGLTEEEFPYFDCLGWASLSEPFDEVYDADLLAAAQAFEPQLVLGRASE